VLDAVVARVLAKQVDDRALARARHIAQAVSSPILYEDMGALRRSLEAAAAGDPELGYALIVAKDGAVLASTFDNGLPSGLEAANRAPPGMESSIVVSDRGTLYRDVSAPILSGELGQVRLGVRLDRVRSDRHLIGLAVGGMVASLLLLGLFGARVLAHIIATPIERLAEAARTFDPAHPAPALELDIPAHGEVADLVRSFDTMAARLHQLHEEQQEFQERIVRAERLATVGALAAGIAHEIGNPLGGIRNCLLAIAREPEDIEQTREFATLMVEATHSIERTVRSLVDVAARSRPEPRQVTVQSLCDRVRVLVRHRFAGAGVRLEVASSASLSPVSVDEGLLQQVLVNLLLNACDASPSGACVRLEVVGEPGELVFQVVDEGSGIAPEVRDRIFEAFVTTKANAGGTGLGLAMVKRVVAELGGTVSFDSELGKGTCFTVRLPTAANQGAIELS
jgi:two-component system NtrC family sensor kinase